ncbi:MAG: MarR family transcriptional regulator [Actinobacteria bacterium]|nr:MarR family transcriptional regulator [Actinomycetota bacterium]
MSDAERAWACMIALFRSDEHLGRFAGAARETGLTAASMKALLNLLPDEEVPMRTLAEVLQCDASNVTQLVDALEEPGYAERVSLPADRRVKLVRLTEVGEKARTTVIDKLHEPPACLNALTKRDQAELARLLSKALAAADPPLDLYHP